MRYHRHPRQDLGLAVRRGLQAEIADQPQFGLVVARHEALVVAERDLPLGALGDQLRARERACAVRLQDAAGMVVVEMAHRDGVHRVGVEAGGFERGQDPRPLVGAHRPALVADPVADAGLHERAPGRSLDQKAVQRLEQPVVVVDLLGHEAVPHHPRHHAQERACVRAETPGLDHGDARAATEFGGPVDGVVERGQMLRSPSAG